MAHAVPALESPFLTLSTPPHPIVQLKHPSVFLSRQVPANERYELEAMPVPVVMVALAGGAGGRVIESKTDREIKACEGGVFFLPAYTPVLVSEAKLTLFIPSRHQDWRSRCDRCFDARVR